MPKHRKRRLNKKRFIFLIFSFLIIISGLSGLGLVAYAVADMPAWNPSSLNANLSTSIYDKDGHLVTKVGVVNRVPVQLSNVPKNLKDAVLATEDTNFYNHSAISFVGIARAAITDILGGSMKQGASTITQQVARMSYLSPDKNFKRKIQEAILAIELERHYTKDEILQMYLNEIPLGQGAYGVESAAQTYFGKSLNELSLAQAAFIAGLPQAPSAYSNYLNLDSGSAAYKKAYETSQNRRDTVLLRMQEAGYISAEQKATAESEPIPDKLFSGQSYPDPFFVDYVTEKLVQKYGEDQVFKGGLKVYTTLDPKIQQIAENALANKNNFPASTVDKNGMEQPEAAAVVIDPKTGSIRALVGGREHKQRRQLNRATQSTRQPGSAFKPIIAYGPAIEYKGLSPASVIDDIPITIGNWNPSNDDGTYRGLTTLRTGLTDSINIVAIRLLQKVGISNAVKFAQGLGITTLDPKNEGLSMALGGLHKGVTPLELAGAYSAFDNSGVYIQPSAITKVERYDGTVLDEFKPAEKQAMKATTAYLVTSMLNSVVQNGTGTRAAIGRPAAGKTGTTDDGKDIWFAGYTPDLVGVVWMGHDQPKAMPQAYGGMYPAQIWHQIMSEALSSVPIHEFQRPPGIVSATVDDKSGLLPGPNTPAKDMVTDLFADGTVPTSVDNLHVAMDICATTGELANPYCPDRITKVLIKLPYQVPDYVQDYDERAPLKTCTLHGPNGINPGSQPATNPSTGTKGQTGQTDKNQNNANDSNTGKDSTNKTDSWLPVPNKQSSPPKQ